MVFMWLVRWMMALFPAWIGTAALAASIGLMAGGPDAASRLVVTSTVVLSMLWVLLPLVVALRAKSFWRALEDPTIEHSWHRAFDEASRRASIVPRILVADEPAPICLLWAGVAGRPSLVVSRSWLLAHDEFALREVFRLAEGSLSESGLLFRTAAAWVIGTVWARLPEGIRNPGRSLAVGQVLLGWPVLLWMDWIRRVMGQPVREESGVGPRALAQRVAFSLLSIRAPQAGSQKTILSLL